MGALLVQKKRERERERDEERKREKQRINGVSPTALIPVYLCVKRTRASSGARNNALSNDVKNGKNFQTIERRATRPVLNGTRVVLPLSKELIHSHLSK